MLGVSEGGDHTDLGDLLYTRDRSIRYGQLALAGFAAVVLSSVGAVACYWFTGERHSAGFVVAAAAFAIIPILVWGHLFGRRVYVFRCFDDGVTMVDPSGTTCLRYSDVGGFTYRGTKYIGLGLKDYPHDLELIFEPAEGIESKQIAFFAKVTPNDPAILAVLQRVSEVLGEQLFAAINNGRTVSWTDRLSLQADGIELAPAGFLSGQPKAITYQEITATQIRKGEFRLFTADAKDPAVACPVSSPNFFPGYFALLRQLDRNMEKPSVTEDFVR